MQNNVLIMNELYNQKSYSFSRKVSIFSKKSQTFSVRKNSVKTTNVRFFVTYMKLQKLDCVYNVNFHLRPLKWSTKQALKNAIYDHTASTDF